jgi:hypothetical protein
MSFTHAIKGYASYELPFGKGKLYAHSSNLMNEIVGGWRLAGTFMAQSGNSFTVINATNDNAKYTGCGNVGGTAAGGDVPNGCNWFPNVVGSVHMSNPNPSEWFNTAAFAAPAGSFAFGNEVRNSLRGPRLVVFNFSLAKNFEFGERVHLQLRSDWVNVFNHPSLGLPGHTLGGDNFGEINAGTQGGGVEVAPRSGQLSARITF